MKAPWALATVRIAGKDNARTEVPAWWLPGVRGLCVRAKSWQITHGATGKRVGPRLKERDAIALFHVLAPITDWTQPVEIIQAALASSTDSILVLMRDARDPDERVVEELQRRRCVELPTEGVLSRDATIALFKQCAVAGVSVNKTYYSALAPDKATRMRQATAKDIVRYARACPDNALFALIWNEAHFFSAAQFSADSLLVTGTHATGSATFWFPFGGDCHELPKRKRFARRKPQNRKP